MGVAGQASTDLSTEAIEVGLCQAPLEKGAGVDARRGVSLKVDLVPGFLLRTTAFAAS